MNLLLDEQPVQYERGRYVGSFVVHFANNSESLLGRDGSSRGSARLGVRTEFDSTRIDRKCSTGSSAALKLPTLSLTQRFCSSLDYTPTIVAGVFIGCTSLLDRVGDPES